ncbi:hypothetical protein ACWENS_10510 [Streptomyces sp. NPDC004532]
MTEPYDPDEDEARTARLLRLSADQIAQYSSETICDWLTARNEQHCARLRSAVQELRKQNAIRERAHARLAAALTPAP